MLGQVEVLLSHEHALTEEVLVDELTVGLGNEPVMAASALSVKLRWIRDVHNCESFLFRESVVVRAVVVVMVVVVSRSSGLGAIFP